MTLPKDEQWSRRMVAAYKEMRAALDIAIEKATIIEKGLESIAPPSGLKKSSVLSDKEIADILAKSSARRKISPLPGGLR